MNEGATEKLKPDEAILCFSFTHLDTAPLALVTGLLRPWLAADAIAGAAKLKQKERTAC